MNTPTLRRSLYHVYALYLIVIGSTLTQAQTPGEHISRNIKDGATMIRIPSGSFFMGTTQEEIDAQFKDTGLPIDWKQYTLDEQPQHKRHVDSFYIYQYEVTNLQYKRFLDATGHRSPPHWSGPAFPKGKARHPVVEVSWNDAQAYCRWAGTRLPTEEQWEYAARGATPPDGQPSPTYPWGNGWKRHFSNNASLHAGKDILSAESWNLWYKGLRSSQLPGTLPVGSFPEGISPFGLHDMAGNAWEWCAELQAPYPELNPESASKPGHRARRGGSWANVALHIRSADRESAAQDNLNLYTGFRCVQATPVPEVPSARSIPVKQAGDQFVNFVLDEIQNTRQALNSITKAAELAAERIVHQNGELLSAGDQSFALEPVWRAGGIAFSRQYVPDDQAAGFPTLDSPEDQVPYYRTKDFVKHFTVNQAGSKDVVLVGFENELEEKKHLTETVRHLISNKALVVFFGSRKSARTLTQTLGQPANLLLITHDVPDGGIIDIPGWPDKICSGRSIANRLYLWTFEAELISAFMRLGKMPGILLSVTYESPQIWNLPLLYSYKFIPAFNVTPVPSGVFGNTYLNHLNRIVASIVPSQRKQFRKAAHWLAEAARSKQQSFALLIHGLAPEGLPGDPGLFRVFSEGNAYYPQLGSVIKPNDVALFVGYNWYPPRLADTVTKAGARQILCFTLVQDQPPTPALYGEVGELRHYTSFDQLPQDDNRIYIDLKFAQYNAVLKIPDYPVPALETSSFAEDVVYWHLVADTIELLAK